MTGDTTPYPPGAVAASECAPQPWSSDTTRPSSGANSFAQTPNTRPSGPASGVRKPQVTQGPGADRASGVPGPCSLEYHRTAVRSRPIADSTLARPAATAADSSWPEVSPTEAARSLPSSQVALSSQSSTPSSPSSMVTGTSRSSSDAAGIRSPTPRSPGRTRSLHGTQSGASSESGPGSSTISLIVTFLERDARLTGTAQRQPGSGAAVPPNRRVTTRPVSAQ